MEKYIYSGWGELVKFDNTVYFQQEDEDDEDSSTWELYVDGALLAFYDSAEDAETELKRIKNWLLSANDTNQRVMIYDLTIDNSEYDK